MTTTLHNGRVRRVQGLSLIELMVSITIGLILMIAISSAYLGSSGASRMAEAQGRMNEDGQTALAILAQQIRMAGDNPRRPGYAYENPSNPVFNGTNTFIVRGCDGTFPNVTSTTGIGDLTCTLGSNSQPDAIAISYEADANNTVPTTSGVPTDCLGQGLTVSNGGKRSGSVVTWDGDVPTSVPAGTVTVTKNFFVADNRFYIKTPASATTPSLYCKGNGGNEQPLVENIQNLQLIYGTAPPTGTVTMAGWLDANEIETNATADTTHSTTTTLADLTTSKQRWDRVMAVRICVLVRSTAAVVSDVNSAAYYPCFGGDNSLTTPTDLYLRRAYYSTVVLRNRMQPIN